MRLFSIWILNERFQPPELIDSIEGFIFNLNIETGAFKIF